MDRVREMEVFAQVAASGSLSAAARVLGLSVGAVSKNLAALEGRLGTRLLLRTTRSLSLSAEGEAFLPRVRALLADLAEAEASVAADEGPLSGFLRVTASAAFGRTHMAPLVAEFLRLHPGLRLHLLLTDTILDLVEGNVDVALRFGVLADSRLVARRLAPNWRVVCASPAYLDRVGRPHSPAELARHECLVIGDGNERVWHFVGPDGDTAVRVGGRLASNNGEVVHAWALDGLGVVLKSVWDVEGDLAAGRLVPVLQEWRSPDTALHAVSPAARARAPRVRRFVDFVAAQLAARGHG
ncbi:MAG: LysR substrate-binding domain-containing protein [Magnetospirillum sp.]|nr:LysR substrate-binding domain-containing protein [Magnetospirillum sp.]